MTVASQSKSFTVKCQKESVKRQNQRKDLRTVKIYLKQFSISVDQWEKRHWKSEALINSVYKRLVLFSFLPHNKRKGSLEYFKLIFEDISLELHDSTKTLIHQFTKHWLITLNQTCHILCVEYAGYIHCMWRGVYPYHLQNRNILSVTPVRIRWWGSISVIILFVAKGSIRHILVNAVKVLSMCHIGLFENHLCLKTLKTTQRCANHLF